MNTLHLVAFAAAVAFSLGMGASGVSASFSSVYAARGIPRGWIPVLFGACVLLGALFSGRRVVSTLATGLITFPHHPAQWTLVILIVCAAGLFIAALFKVPQSTSQTTVAAMVGVGLHVGELHVDTLIHVFACWLALPIGTFLLTYLIGRFAYRPIQSEVRSDLLDAIRENAGLKALSVITACGVAYSIGANNVANAVGPLAAGDVLNPLAGILVMAPHFGLGALALGSRILKDVGDRITAVGPIGSVYVALVSATLLLAASYLGIPQSIVQLNMAAVVGIGTSKQGFGAMFRQQVVRRVIVVWLATPPLALLAAWAAALALRGSAPPLG